MLVRGVKMECSRVMVYFSQVEISDVILLGRVNNTKSQPPLKLHIHKGAFEICYHSTGSQSYNVNNEYHITNGGDVFLTFPNEQHSTGTRCEDKSFFYFFIFKLNKKTKNFMGFDEKATEYIKDILFNLKNRHFKGTNKFKNIFNEIIDIYYSKNPMKNVRIKALLTEFFFQLVECAKNDKTVNYKDMASIKSFIDNNPLKHFTIEELSAMTFLSESRFKQKFKEYTGIPPIEYSIRAKINQSKNMLLDGSLSITDIAYKLGFSSSQHFSTVFKKYMNLTPKEYARLNRCNDSK